MSEDEFWEITPRAFFNAIEGFESFVKTNLEVTRLQTLCYVNVWAKPQITDPRKLWRYPWENVDRRKELADRALRMANKFDRIEKRHADK